MRAGLIRKQRELDLTIGQRVSEGLAVTRDQARKEAGQEQKLGVAEKEKTIAAMQRQIEDFKRRAEQGPGNCRVRCRSSSSMSCCTAGSRSTASNRFPRVNSAVTSYSVLPVAVMLRQSLIEVAQARQAVEGEQTRTEMICRCLSGPRCRQRVEAIVEAFSTMRTDLDKERRAIMKQWARRDVQIGRVMQPTVGLYADLQGIAGMSLQEIDGPGLQARGMNRMRFLTDREPGEWMSPACD